MSPLGGPLGGALAAVAARRAAPAQHRQQALRRMRTTAELGVVPPHHHQPSPRPTHPLPNPTLSSLATGGTRIDGGRVSNGPGTGGAWVFMQTNCSQAVTYNLLVGAAAVHVVVMLLMHCCCCLFYSWDGTVVGSTVGRLFSCNCQLARAGTGSGRPTVG